MAERFFAVSFVGEYVHVWGIPAWGPWNASSLHFSDEPTLDLSLKFASMDGERKIRTWSEIDAAIREFQEVSTPRTLWVPERLMDDVRRLWEKRHIFRNKVERHSPARPSR